MASNLDSVADKFKEKLFFLFSVTPHFLKEINMERGKNDKDELEL